MDTYKELVKQAIEGNRRSQSELYDLLSPKMYAVCLWYAKNSEEAADIMQEGFIKMFRSMQQYKSTGSFEGWVRKIMVNTAIDTLKTSKKLFAYVTIEEIPEELEPESSTDYIIEKIGMKSLLEMVQNLPMVYRLVFNLYVFEGLKHKEIARLLNISVGTSKSNLFYARKSLQKKINYVLDADVKSVTKSV